MVPWKWRVTEVSLLARLASARAESTSVKGLRGFFWKLHGPGQEEKEERQASRTASGKLQLLVTLFVSKVLWRETTVTH